MIQLQAEKSKQNLDPRVKVILLICISVISISGSISSTKIYPRLALALIPAILFFLLGKNKIGLVYSSVFLLSWYAESFLVPAMTGVSNLLLVIVTGMITRFSPSIMMGYYFLKTTSVSELISAMQKLHIPLNFTIPLAVMFRFFPTIAEESQGITDAMRMRAITYLLIFKNPIKLIEYRFVPLMASIVKIGDELAASALTRGLGVTHKRTSIETVKLGSWDYGWLLVLFGLVFTYCSAK